MTLSYGDVETAALDDEPAIRAVDDIFDSAIRSQDNQTIVLGGLMRDTSNETISKVPGLSEIPIIGKIFQNKQTAHERDEIVFLITPHVIYPGAEPPVK